MSDPLDESTPSQAPTHSDAAQKAIRDEFGKFVKKFEEVKLPPLIQTHEDTSGKKDEDPPMIYFKWTNPVAYLKYWWKKIIGNEGVELKGDLKIKPMTAISIVTVPTIIATFIIVSGTIGITLMTNFLTRGPLAPLTSGYLPSPTPNPWKPAAYTGNVYINPTGQPYLITSDSDVVSLEVPVTIDLTKLTGKLVLARGQYNSDTKMLRVTESANFVVVEASQ